MENEKNYKKIIIFLIIVVILLMLCILFITGNLNFSSNDRNNNSNENSNQDVIDNNSNNNENNVDYSDYKLEAKTKVKIDLLWDDKFDNIEVINGDLMVNDRVFTIPNDKDIKVVEVLFSII